ncbi:unnamed protein product [Kuraishia capsulata CBS 1993]|uniref:Uncharacterized protein n=1 Tax=Kuraishia capsulata CBS 1993 TaxID=1382522 RepID=W6MH42_9ASCO|nr:uncharacterized protein KUCA_T00001484001 [Kuraishia capsulata CBS 1993]CDK25514.1 unnamed protein product [Kuraishia capsulata CBS 1993]
MSRPMDSGYNNGERDPEKDSDNAGLSETLSNRLRAWLGALPESPSSPSTLGAPSPSSAPMSPSRSMAGDLSRSSELCYPKFDPTTHLRYRQGHLSKEVKLLSLGVEESDQMDITGEGALPLFTKQCCEIMRRELINCQQALVLKRTNKKKSSLRYLSHGKQYNEKHLGDRHRGSVTPLISDDRSLKSSCLAPTLRECADVAPFCYSALTHPKSIAAVSAIAGQDLQICPDLEIAHIALCRLDPLAKHKKASAITKESGTSTKSVAYPFICVVRLTGDDSSFELPPIGYSTILQGRFTENIAKNQLCSLRLFANSEASTKKQIYNVVLTATFQPRDIIKYEDGRFLSRAENYVLTAKKLVLTLCYKDNQTRPDTAQESADDYKNVEKYVSWLKNYYDSGQAPDVDMINPSVMIPNSPTLSTSSV